MQFDIILYNEHLTFMQYFADEGLFMLSFFPSGNDLLKTGMSPLLLTYVSKGIVGDSKHLEKEMLPMANTLVDTFYFADKSPFVSVRNVLDLSR